MNQVQRIYEKRFYEGEWAFACANGCGGYCVEYSFDDWDNLSEEFLDSRVGGHAWTRCQNCGGVLRWAGYSGERPISKSFVSLIENKHYMAATVILAAITESFVSALLFAVLADRGLSHEHANRVANSPLGRHGSLMICRQLTGWTIPDLAFPVRNIVAHGKGFGQTEDAYCTEVIKQVKAIRNWVDKLYVVGQPKWFCPSELDRWLLFMNHWSQWLMSYVGRTTAIGAESVALDTAQPADAADRNMPGELP